MILRDLLPFAFVAAPLLLGCDVDREFDGMEMDGTSETELPEGVEANDMILIIENEEGGRIHLWVDFTRDGDLLWGTARATRFADADDAVQWRPVGRTEEIRFLDTVDIEERFVLDLEIPAETSFLEEARTLYFIFDATQFSDTLICGTVSDEIGDSVDNLPFVAWPVTSIDEPDPDFVCQEM